MRGFPNKSGYHTAVWTGSEMIVWGGTPDGGATNFNSGGRYNPATDTWITSSVGANVPVARNSHTAVWTGGEMMVWGGSGSLGTLNTGGRYNPATDSWLPTSIGANVPAGRYFHTAVWAGGEMMVWGGTNGSYFDNGGIYSTFPAAIGTSLRGGKSATVDLSWIVASGASSYNVKRCTGICPPFTTVATPATNSYSETMDATSYFYAVEAVNACGVTP